jgi:arginyl-tRNA synthetase
VGVAFLAERRRSVEAAFAAAHAAAIEAGALPACALPAFHLEPPRPGGTGHLACNLALVLAGVVQRAPRQVAETLLAHLPHNAIADLAEASIAGPGFINLTFAPGWLAPVVSEVLAAGASYGSADVGAGRRVLVEFVSANPTGPLNVVNCRQAAFGDALVRCLRAVGYAACAEYYVNDAGGQFRKLGQSLEARVREQLGEGDAASRIPDGGYPGEYLIPVAQAYLATEGPAVLSAPEAERVEVLARFAVEHILAGQMATLARFGVHYDQISRESAIRARRGPEQVLAALQQAVDEAGEPYVYERDGALWLRSTRFGDHDDRVLRKSDGEFTYRLPDIAYHVDKFARGFDLLIDLLGQDHHGDVPGVRAALQILGQPVDRLEVLLTQLVRLVQGGTVQRISKRGGAFVTMDAFLDEVGADAARFFFLMHTLDTHMDFDVELARRQSQENPVYYVQYAHARICSILRQATVAGVSLPGSHRADAETLHLLTHPAEEELLQKLAVFPDEVWAAAQGRAPHRLTVYARQVAERFHSFYVQCRVLGENPPLTAARLALCGATRIVLARTLELLGVAAPERMDAR